MLISCENILIEILSEISSNNFGGMGTKSEDICCNMMVVTTHATKQANYYIILRGDCETKDAEFEVIKKYGRN